MRKLAPSAIFTKEKQMLEKMEILRNRRSALETTSGSCEFDGDINVTLHKKLNSEMKGHKRFVSNKLMLNMVKNPVVPTTGHTMKIESPAQSN